VAAAGGCTIRHRNRDVALAGPIPIDTATGMAKMPRPVRVILRIVNVTEFVELHRAINPPPT